MGSKPRILGRQSELNGAGHDVDALDSVNRTVGVSKSGNEAGAVAGEGLTLGIKRGIPGRENFQRMGG